MTLIMRLTYPVPSPQSTIDLRTSLGTNKCEGGAGFNLVAIVVINLVVAAKLWFVDPVPEVTAVELHSKLLREWDNSCGYGVTYYSIEYIPTVVHCSHFRHHAAA